MDEKIKTLKQIPFKQINPSKFIGINSQLPFNTIISQSKLLYFSGRSIILQNIKTYQQKIIWTNEYENRPQKIQHIKNSQRQNILAIAVCDNSQNHTVFILHINSVLNNYEHISVKQRSKDRLHYLKNIDQDDKIIKLNFLNDGIMFGIIVTQKGSQNQQSNNSIYIYNSLNGDCIYNCDFIARDPIIEDLMLNRQNYACIIKNQPQKQDQNDFIQKKHPFIGRKSFCNQEFNIQSYFSINLINLGDLSSNNQLLIDLEQGQSILQIKFMQNYRKMLAFFLLDSGFILGYMFNQKGFHQKIRIDTRINKTQHSKKNQTKMNQNNFLQQIDPFKIESVNVEQTRQIQQKQIKDNLKHTSGVKRYHSNENALIVESDELKMQIKEKNLTKKNIKSFKKKDLKEKINKTQYFIPCCISSTNNKIVIGYEKCSFIGVVQYSGVDHRQYKFWYIDDFFVNRPQIESIRKINFSEDGCHCSVLVKVRSFLDTKNQVFNNESKVNYKPQSRNQIKQFTEQQLFQQTSSQNFNLLQVDFVSGLIQHSYHNESIEQSLTCCSLNGYVECVEFISQNNTMFVLMNDNRLCYCTMNLNKLTKNDRFAQNNFVVNNGKKGGENQQSPNNNLGNQLSQSMLLWSQNIRTKPYLIISHPIVFQIVLIFQDSIKFHYYNHQKLFEHHHAISLKNCKAASYSLYGDKLALGSLGSIWIMDSYTYTIVKKIPLVIFPIEVINKVPDAKQERKPLKRSTSIFTSLSAKTVSKIQYINNYDIMIQTGNTTLSILLNYQKVLFFGSTSQAIHGDLFFYDNKHHLGVIASQDCVKVIRKCSVNSKNKCEQLAKIEIVITAIRLCGQIDILFLGGKNGILYFVRWPDFLQNDAIKYPTLKNKLYLFHSAIIDIKISINYKQLFVTSQQGMMIICDLIHSDDVQKIGKDVSFRMSKKLDFKLPLINKWLVSKSDSQRRAQNLTKLIGNEAEIKINQNTFTQEYKSKLQLTLQEKKIRLNQQLKQEIKKYEIDTGISKLQLDIALTWDQLKSIEGKRQAQSRQLNSKIDADLHKVFVEKEKLQKQFKELKIKTQQEKQSFIKQLQKMIEQNDQNKQENIQQTKKMQNESINFFNEKMVMDRGMQQHMKEDFQDELNQAKLFYGGQLEEIKQNNNYLGQQNRRIKVQMMDMEQKMKEFSERKEELQGDVNEIQKQRQNLNKIKLQLSQQIVETDQKYHQLIKRTKQLQTTLNKTRTSSQACQMRFDQLEKEMQILQDKWDYLQKKAEQNSNDFVQQYNFRNAGMNQQKDLKQKIIKLKQKRKQLFQKKVLLKDLLKPYEKQIPQQKQDENLTYSNNQSLQIKKSQGIKMASDVDKWTNFKDQSKIRMVKNNQKLQQQTNKLMFRLNQMMKQHKQLANKQNNLKQAIKSQRQKLNLSLTSNNWEKFSFVPIIQKQEEEKMKTINYISLNRQSLNKDNKFNSTSCHFSSSHSLNKNENIKKFIEKPLGFLKQKDQDSKKKQSSISKLNKVSSKNLQALIYQKKATLKQLKKQSSNNSLYHGVTLDPKTLKPNKTLCISLHKQGSQAKFVTQY